MEKDQLSRKLAVILHADVVGSTSLVQKDEVLAHQRIQDTFSNFSKTIESYGGLAREIRGDALVAEFDRASDAVTAAIAFQDLNDASNDLLDDDIKPQLRIGISLGEVVIANNTITGAGVVIAQRLEQLAEPGCIVIQGSVAETVPNRMPFNFKGLGEQDLKGFDEPVRAFTANLQPGKEIPNPELRVSQNTDESRQVPETPSIAVLPFTNLSGDSAQDYFGDGLTQDIISTLSRFKDIHVVAYHSVHQYKTQKSSIEKIAAEQGVRYILEGSIRTSGDRIRVNAELIDAETGANCWVDQYDRELVDIFKVQDDITKNITAAMRVKFSGGDRERVRAKGTENIKAWGLSVMADDLLDEYKRDNLIEAHRMAAEAIELDPSYCNAWVVKGWAHWEEAYCGWGDFDNSLLDAEKAAFQANKLDPNDSGAWSLISLTHMLKQEPAACIEAGRKAVNLCPGSAEAQSLYGAALQYGGQLDEAWSAYEISLKLSPIYPAHFLLVGGQVCMFKGKFKDAIDILQRAVDLQPDSPLVRFYLLDALLENGEESKAKMVADEIRNLDPTFRINGVVLEYSRDEKRRDRFKANLNRMGFFE